MKTYEVSYLHMGERFTAEIKATSSHDAKARLCSLSNNGSVLGEAQKRKAFPLRPTLWDVSRFLIGLAKGNNANQKVH